ncbi:hypothetical protein AAG906_009942 [Vitis piasezkii]
MMMMPLMTTSNPNAADANTLFLPLPPNHNHDLNRNSSRGSSLILENHNHNQHTTTTSTNNHHGSDPGCYFMKPMATTMAALLLSRLRSWLILTTTVGAPPEVVARLEEACASEAAMVRTGTSCIGEDPALDQFMEAYCEMLTKYEQELSKPFKEAMLFLSRVECQFKALTVSSSDSAGGEGLDRNGSSEEEVDVNNNFIDPQAEDRELKGQLLQEFMKKRKKGKLPKEARQQLLDWWSRHYKWPYPSESQKLALAESTGLDQKQINNWFINQRKRHWKPSEDMQFVVMDATSRPLLHGQCLGQSLSHGSPNSPLKMEDGRLKLLKMQLHF